MTDRLRDGGIDRDEFRQMEGFQHMPDHRRGSYDTENNLIGMQGMVPGKEIAQSTEIHASHLGTIEDDMMTGPLLGLNNLLKTQRVKGIHMPGKGHHPGGRMIRDVEVQHTGFIGKKEERVKSILGKGQLGEEGGTFDLVKLDNWIK